MNLHFLGRIKKEISITGHALHETILAVAERVNRKVHVLRLHWKAASLVSQIDEVRHLLGQQIVTAKLVTRSGHAGDQTPVTDLDRAVTRAQTRVQELNLHLSRFEDEIRQMKLETIHEDLLRLQQDLSARAAGIERVIIPRGAASAGQPLRNAPRSSTAIVAMILRGPYLLAPQDDLLCRPGDIVVLLGNQMDLERLAVWLTRPRHAKAPLAPSPSVVPH